MSKPRVLVLGGVGFIGRNLVTYLVEEDLASHIRVADKAMPQMSYLAPRHKAAFDKGVEYVQANLARPANIAKAFTHPDGEFDYVFNCAALTKYGQDEVVYKENVFDVSVNCAQEAAKRGIKKFVEVSTAQIYAPDKKPSREDGKTKPWTHIANFKLQVEQELAKVSGLNYVVVRPAIVYGSGDMLGLTPRLIVGAVYKQLGETMKLLWTDKLKLNTVHVDDVSKALFVVAEKGAQGEVYNLADKADSTQGSISDLVAQLFGIKTGYYGTVLSNLAKLNLKDAAEESNEKHMQPWMEMCQGADISNTPLTPYLDQELLYNNSLSVDGSKIEGLGFSYEKPAPTLEELKKVVQDFVDLKVFPPGKTI
eukprot:m.31587 g.31587  ORF g.31587 m.31587 type:complete len:366 (+) comp9786_c0_seq1:194-1291(+)